MRGIRKHKAVGIIVAIGLVFTASDAASAASFTGRLISFALVFSAFYGVGKLLESHYTRHPESTSFALRRTHL